MAAQACCHQRSLAEGLVEPQQQDDGQQDAIAVCDDGQQDSIAVFARDAKATGAAEALAALSALKVGTAVKVSIFICCIPLLKY